MVGEFLKLQILDVSYFLNRKKEPIISIFGKTEIGSSKTILVEGFRPYFYALPNCEEEFLFENAGLIEESFDYNIKIEVVQKYKPMGYQSNPTSMYKIKYINPRDTREIRGLLISKHFVKELYEADILFKNQFMIDLGLRGFSWIEIPCNRIIKYNDIKPIAHDQDTPLKKMGIDIEVLPNENLASTDTDKNEIIIISLAFEPEYNGKKNLVLLNRVENKKPDIDNVCYLDNESNLLIKLMEIVKEYDPDIIIDYNGNEFDLPFIDGRLEKLGLSKYIGKDRRSWYYRFDSEKTVWVIPGRIHIDLLPLIKKHVNPTEFKNLKHPLKSYSLKYVASQLLDIQKMDVKFSEMRGLWLSDNYIKFVEYARRDAELLIELLNKVQLLDKYIALAKASGCLLQDVLNGGQTTMIDNLIIRAFKEANRVVPMKTFVGESNKEEEVKYAGATVLQPITGLHENIIIMDFASLYPSIMRAYNLSPDTIYYENGETKFKTEFPGIVPKVLEKLYNERVEYKKQMKMATDPKIKEIYNLKQYGCKILLNSIYGYFGFAKSRLFEISIAAKVTEEGRKALALTKSVVESYGCQVIAGDTDSVFIKGETYNDFNTAVQFANKIHDEMEKKLPSPMSLAFESYGKRGILLAKKRYAILITEDGNNYKIKQRGVETRRRDWCQYTEDTLSNIFDILLNNGDIAKAGKYAKDRIDRISKLQNVNDDPELLEQLVLSKKYSKPLDQYKSKTMHIEAMKKAMDRGSTEFQLGDRISFYVVAYHSDQVTECTEVVDYVIDNNVPINKKYYIDVQLMPPLHRIFDVLGYNIIIGKPISKQLSLTEMFK